MKLTLTKSNAFLTDIQNKRMNLGRANRNILTRKIFCIAFDNMVLKTKTNGNEETERMKKN